MPPLWIFLIFYSLSSATLVINRPVGGPLNVLSYREADFCTSAPTLSNVPLVLVQNTATCDGLSIPASVTGKIAYTPYCATCCPISFLAQSLSQAGAIGFLQGSSAGLTGTGALVTQPLFCWGTASQASNLVNWLQSGQNVTVDISQPLTNSSQLAALLELHAQSSASVWPVELDPCSATLPVPPSRTIWKGIVCNIGGFITQLTIPFPINGKIPESFCALSTLTTLIIQDDITFTELPSCAPFNSLSLLTISGTSMQSINEQFLMLPNLINLDLSNNLLTGFLDFTNWTSPLNTVRLQGNHFTSLASPINLPSVLELNLARNKFTGAFPDFTPSAQLVTLLDISDNGFTNFTIPPENSWPIYLRDFRMSYNNLIAIPQAIVDLLPDLATLLANNNELTSLPDLQAMGSLDYLDVSNNQLSGVLNVITPFMSTFIAANNRITSIGPSSGELLKIDLTNNSLSGPFILSSSFPFAQYWYVKHNNITSISFLQMARLIGGDFSDNALSGSLTSWTYIPRSLFSLDLSNNRLTGVVPNSLLTTLVQVRLTGNDLFHGSSSILPARVVFTFDITQPFLALGLECPTYTLKDTLQSEFTVDPSYHEHRLCRCLTNYFRKSNSTICIPCLPNAICPGKEDPLTVTTNLNILAKPGYFPLPTSQDPIMMVECRFGVVLPNDPRNPCNPSANIASSSGNVSAARFSCAEGYTDRLCSQCKAGWFRKEGRCLLCNGRPEYPLFLIAIVLIFLSACTFFAYRQPVDMSTTSINPDGWTFEPKQRVYDFIPLILHFFQVSTIILTKLQALDVVHTVNSLLVTASFSTPQSGIGFECGLPVFQGFITQYLAVVIFPPILACVLACFFLIRILYHFYRQETQNWNMHLYQYFYGLFSMFEAIHFPLVTYVLGVFQCTKDPISGISYLTDHPYLLCSSISPAGKVFPLLLYPIGLVGFFVCLGVYLHYAPSDVKESEPVIQSFAFFYIRFKPDRVASGVFFIFLNLGLSLVVGLMEPNNDVFPTLIILILVIDFFFVTVFQPYLQPRYNKVRMVNDLVALLLFVNNLIYSSSEQFPGRSASPAVIYIGLNLGMVIFYCYHLYRIVKLHRTDLRLMRANSGGVDPHHRPEVRKHVELAEIKSRKHTNIDPPSTSHGDAAATNHVYVPVAANPPLVADSVEISGHSPLPIISENETTSDFGSPKTSGGLIFTENPLADTSATSFPSVTETPPSPSSKE